ncbi:MAG: lamin tail domain-containing protein, partial [Chloroflexi bacterium]|nr:lamin tail domain-containing protein [Chloroflexota bacterium]
MAPFYYDTGGGISGNTPLNDMRTRYTCIFLRQSFAVSNLPAIGSLTLTAFIDDGFIAWINGREIYRYNKAAGEPVYTDGTPAALEPAWVSTNVTNPGSFLVNGANVLAIQAFNRNLTSSDFVLDVELRSDVPDRDPPTVLSVNPPPGTVGSLGQVIVTFNEPVLGVTADDLLVNNRPALSVTGSGAVYTFTFAQPAYGVVDITWEAGTDITDRASPPNAFAETGAGWQYQLVDTVAPGLALVTPVAGATVRKLTQVEITFSEPVSGVQASDLLVNGQAASNVAGASAGPYVFQFAAPATGLVQVAWSANHGILDLAAPANPFGGGSWSYTLDPNAVMAQVVINEFLSATLATGGLLDEEGELQDWIELYNTGTNAVNLAGWSLSDEADEPAKWTFPSVTLGGGQYLVVFASAKDRKATTPGAKLHTNFKLNSAGDYLALFNAESPRQAMTEFRPEFPEQRNDYSYGLDNARTWRYFRTPTPGRANGSSTITGVAPPPHFNVRRGFFERPFQLMLSDELSGATIPYTLDGSPPTELSGLVYAAPLR